ncbi:hypothetical protein M0802_009767 [Mischocyttarus mexicanus]|nr:hypothetical protein M0802_009767 [Mischocyttarus mexicanus]
MWVRIGQTEYFSIIPIIRIISGLLFSPNKRSIQILVYTLLKHVYSVINEHCFLLLLLDKLEIFISTVVVVIVVVVIVVVEIVVVVVVISVSIGEDGGDGAGKGCNSSSSRSSIVLVVVVVMVIGGSSGGKKTLQNPLMALGRTEREYNTQAVLQRMAVQAE